MTTKASQHVVSALKLATEQASTSGTAIDFTGIPSGTKQINILAVGVSLNGAGHLLVQPGISSGPVTSGYTAITTTVDNAGASAAYSPSTGFGLYIGDAAQAPHWVARLTLKNASTNEWLFEANGVYNGTNNITGAGSVTLSGTLDRVRITSSAGDTFDAGSINIAYN